MDTSKRDRVEAVLSGTVPGRTPYYDLLYNDAVFEHLTGSRPATGQAGLEQVCRGIGAALDMVRGVTPPAEPGTWNYPAGTVYEGFSRVIERWTSWLEDRPFDDEDGAAAWIERAIAAQDTWQPTSESIQSYRDGIAEQVRMTDGTVVLHHPSPVGLDTAYIHLGWENISVLQAEEPDLLDAYLESLAAMEIRRVHSIADRDLSPVVLTYSDIACKTGLLFSPAFLRRAFIPRLERLVAAWHEHGVSCLFHSDGDLSEISDDLVGAGIDGLNPLENTPGWDIFKAYERHGDRLYYAGGMCVRLLSQGTPEETRALRQRIIETVPAHRLFLGSTTELSDDMRLENVLAMWKAEERMKAEG